MAKSDRTACFCKRIKEVRTSKKISPRWIAKKVGITKTEYLQIEDGKTDNLDLETAMGIAFVLDVNMNYLCGFSDDLLPTNLCTVLNDFDVNNESENLTRTILHEVMLMDDEEKKDFEEHLRKEGLFKD